MNHPKYPPTKHIQATGPNNLELIRVVDFCNSLHIYESDWEQAKTVKPAILPPNLMR